MSRTLSGLFLVGALHRPRKRKRTNRENPRTIPEQIGKIPEKSGKSQTGQKRTKKEGQVQIGKPPRLKPRLAALDFLSVRFATKRSKALDSCVGRQQACRTKCPKKSQRKSLRFANGKLQIRTLTAGSEKKRRKIAE